MSDTTTMMPTWEQRTIRIAYGPIVSDNGLTGYVKHDGDPEWQEAEAEVWGAFAIHATTGGWRNADWSVTHVPSGRLMVQTWTRQAARRFCLEVAPLTDWERITPAARPPADVRSALIAAVRRAGRQP